MRMQWHAEQRRPLARVLARKIIPVLAELRLLCSARLDSHLLLSVVLPVALQITPRIESFCWRVERLAGEKALEKKRKKRPDEGWPQPQKKSQD